MGKTARYFYRPKENDALIPAETVLYATQTQQKPRQRGIQAQKNRLSFGRCAATSWGLESRNFANRCKTPCF